MKGFGFKQLKRKEGPSFYLSGFKEKRKRNTAANKLIAAALLEQQRTTEGRACAQREETIISGQGELATSLNDITSQSLKDSAVQ